MHLPTKLAAAAAFTLILNAIPASAQQPWTPLESGDWYEVTWNRGSEYGIPGDEDAILITGREITNGSATHTGEINIQIGGKLTSYSSQLRTGIVQVLGPGSEWIANGIQEFDKGDDQALIIMDGRVETSSTRIGITGGQQTVASVIGSGGELKQDDLTVGYSGNGVLYIFDSGVVTANNTVIGARYGGAGWISVDGVVSQPPAAVEQQTTLNSGNLLTVGQNQGSGGLEITNGGRATAKEIVIGGQKDGVGGSGMVAVTGRAPGTPRPVSSRLSATEGDIKIGDGGFGHLIVNDYGQVSASGKIILGSNGGVGTITIGDLDAAADPFTAQRTGTVSATEIHGDGGEAKVNLHLSSVYDIGVSLSTRITGNTQVNIDGWEGGTAILANNNTYSGGTNIYGAGLIVSNANQVGTGTIYVNGGSLYLGSGVTLTNQIELAGGSYSKETEEGEDLTMNVQSAETGGVTTSAGILAGTQSTASAVTTNFGLASDAGNDDLRISDVFSLSGTGDSVFVLELAVDNLQPGAFLSWLDTDSGLWVNAIDGNIGNTDYSLEQFLGTYEEFSLLNGGVLADHLGAWGIYDSGVWAVINHNSDFSIVAPIPEPSTYALILGGVAALHFIRRKRK